MHVALSATPLNRCLLALAFLIARPAVGQELRLDSIAGCAEIDDESDRLACYDRMVERGLPPLPNGDEEKEPAPLPHVGFRRPVSPLAERWELDRAAKRGLFGFRSHRQSYFIPARYSNAPNHAPRSPVEDLTPMPSYPLNSTEAKFQISFKFKVAEDIGGSGTDFWFGYTQQSHWQVYNKKDSRPFRETNYEPEAMLVVPVNRNVLGLRLRFVNLGLDHQSNGRAGALSRGWNRLYQQVGLERGGFALFVRAWQRVREPGSHDDNPDIGRFMGYGDIVAVYQLRNHSFAALVRNNLRRSENHGALELDWSFRLVSNLKGYVQFFSGYGESMIDYNHRQSAIGLGVLINDWI